VRRALALTLALAASSAWACATEQYDTRVLGWDAQTRTFVIERKRSLRCAGCACTLSARAFRLVGATGTPTEVFVARSDSCGASFSVLPPESPEPEGAELFKKATEAWAVGRPVVERAAVSSLEEDLTRASWGDARVEVRLGDVVLKHPFADDGDAWLQHFEGDAFRDVLSPTKAEKPPLTNDTPGPRKLVVSRGKQQIAVVSWTPTCHDPGCHDLRLRWANDGSAVAIVAGLDHASFDPAPGHQPKQQPARVFVVDLATGKVSQDQLSPPWPADAR
jgi:hypothetical protein